MDKRTRKIATLVFDDVHLVDVAGPAEAFHETKRHSKFTYQLLYFSPNDRAVRSSCGLRLCPDIDFVDIAGCDDLLITGGSGIDRILDHEHLICAIRNWQKDDASRRLISVCAGALLLARAGVLDEKVATTHWSRAADARNLGPNVSWDFDRIFTSAGQVYSSAGVTAGIDLALHIISQDAGHVVACNVARQLVVPLQRSGGQSQHSVLVEARERVSDRLRPLIDQIIGNPSYTWSLQTMADAVNLTPRTLARHMRADLHTSPAKLVEQIRVQYAVNLLELGGNKESVAQKAGFGTIQKLNRTLKRHLNTSTAQLERVITPPQL